MIESKEQYRWITEWSVDHDMSLDDQEKLAVWETIEALREVARAGRRIRDAYDNVAEEQLTQLLPNSLMLGNLRDSLDALPDWILE